MSNVLIEKDKLDILATAISNKSGEPLKLTLDEMVEAVDGIETGGGGITPSGNINITQAGVTDVTNYSTATVPQGEIYIIQPFGRFKTVSNVRKWEVVSGGGIVEADEYGHAGYVADDTWENVTGEYNAVPSGTTITPTESSQTIGGADTMLEGAVTVNAIPSNYVGSGITQRSSSDLTASGATVTVPSGYYSAQASKAVASGTAGTPTATKGTVSNHSISVTPSVTNTSGYITGSTKTGTAVTVSASELVSGTYTVDSSGTKDVTNYASASVPSGTEGTPTATKGTVSNHSISVTPSVTNASGFISGGTKTGTAVTVSASELASGNKAITQNGTGIDVVGYSTVSVSVEGGGGYTWETVVDQDITVVADNPNYFVFTYNTPLVADETYRVTWGTGGTQYICDTVYTSSTAAYDSYYIGNAGLVSLGSDTGEPFIMYRDRATRMVGVTNRSAGSWYIKIEKQVSTSATLIEKTITANGTYDAEDDNADGYSSVTVNVPSGSPTIQSLTVAPSTSQQTFNASGVDGYKPVTVAAVSQTNLTAENIKSGTTVTISNGTSNLWSVTGTYSGGGSSDVATGTLTVASNVNTSTSTQITTTTAIGFTPTKFFFWKDARAATSNHVNQATFTTIGSYYIRTMTRYSNNTLSTSGNANSWTTQTAGYLYFNNNTIYFRSSSSYILPSGTWSWVAVK